MDTQQRPPIPPPIEEMNRIGIWLLDTLKNQGLSFVLLGVAVWFLQTQNNQLAREVKDCNTEKYNALITVVQSNTEALNRLTNGKEEKETTPPKRR